MPYNFAADSFHTKKLCSRLSSTRSHLSPLFTFLCYCSNDNSRQTQCEFVVCIHVLTDVTSRVIKTYDVYDVYAIGLITWCIMNIYEVTFDMSKQQATCSIRHSTYKLPVASTCCLLPPFPPLGGRSRYCQLIAYMLSLFQISNGCNGY